jgi:hypothetical protein
VLLGQRRPGEAPVLILAWLGTLAAILTVWGLTLWGGLALWNILNGYYAG